MAAMNDEDRLPKTPELLSGAAISWGGEIFLDTLRQQYSAVQTSFRVNKICNQTQREGESIVINASLQEFFEYIECPIHSTLSLEHPFAKLPNYQSQIVSVYADYKHFQPFFSNGEEEEEDKSITPHWGKWNELPYTHVTTSSPAANTLWLGTYHSHTPLHYDSYGCNIVVQLIGRKRWQLWKPNDCKDINSIIPPTRIPYEESSVYSTYDPLLSASIIGNTTTTNESCSQYIKPDYEFLLHPGDVLFVPKHFWHFVITEDPLSLSVNQWCSLASDKQDQVAEAVVKFTHAAIVSALESTGFNCHDPRNGWICPSEIEDTVELKKDGPDELGDEVAVDGEQLGSHGMSSRMSHVMNIDILIDCLHEANAKYQQMDTESILKLVVNQLLNPDNIAKCVNKLLK